MVCRTLMFDLFSVTWIFWELLGCVQRDGVTVIILLPSTFVFDCPPVSGSSGPFATEYPR
jgi:hypothetical protein